MSIQINTSKENDLPKLSLCKPNLQHTTIGKLTDIYNIKLHYKLGTINELTFEVPLLVERNHTLIENPFIKRFDGYYHVKVEHNGHIEYFVYVVGNKSFSNDRHTVNYRLFSTGYLLNKKIIRSYEEESKTLSFYAREILRESDWTLDYCDVDFDLKYRALSISESTILECLYNLAEKFGAIIVWDTVNQKVNFHKPENIGINKGLTFREGIFLESYDVEYNFDEIVTRLYVYGQDGLEFRRFSPTGSNYLESLNWFMYPFECDANWNVMKSSKHMSDDLCIAIRKYEKKLKDHEGQFNNLVTQRTNKEDESIQRAQELSILKAELKQSENELWVINKTLNDMHGENELSQIANQTDKYTSAQIQAVENDRVNAVNRKKAKESQIATKQNQIASIKNEIISIESNIAALRNTLKIENNYTYEQLLEMNKFIIHKSYTNDSISNEEDLLKEGLDVFKKVSQLPVTLNLSAINFLKDIRFELLKDRITLGDTVRLKSEAMDIYIEAKIIEISYDFDNQTFGLVIANEKNIKDNWTALLEKIYSASNTSTTVNMDRYKWDKAQDALTSIDHILNNEFDAAKNAITSGYMDLTTLDRFGLKSYEHNQSDTFLFINNAILGITANNLNTVEVAISKNGVHANRLVGKIILSNKVVVEDTLGVVEIKNGLQTIYDNQGSPRVYLGRYPSPDNTNQFKYGLRIVDGSFDIRTSPTTNRGIQIDGNGFRAFNNNSVKTFSVDAASGQVEIVGGIKIKTHPDAMRGAEIDGNGLRVYGNSGQLVFNADHFGNIYYAGRLQGATGSIDNVTGSVNNLTGSISAMDGTFRGNLTAAGGTFKGTLQAVDGVFTGSLQAATGTFNGIVTGSLSTQTARAVTIEVDQLRANNAQVTNLSAISSNLGDITGGSIRIDTDMKIGNNLYLGNSIDWRVAKSIIFAGSAGIHYNSDTLTMSAFESVNLDSSNQMKIEAFNDMQLNSKNIYITGNLYVNGRLIN